MRPATSIPLLVVALVGAAAWWWSTREPPAPPPPAPPPEPATGVIRPLLQPSPGATGPLSPLARRPDWSIFRHPANPPGPARVLEEMTGVYTTSDSWKQWFQLGESELVADTGDPSQRAVVPLSPDEDPFGATLEPYWRPASEFSPANPDRPLRGVQIAIDPGHIGGDWAVMEERWFQLGDDPPVKEGNLTLLVAQLLAPRLEELGARVSFVREDNEPVTRKRPGTLARREPGNPAGSEAARLAERLFYRTAEIHARARLVNEQLQPDLVICLHFNAEAWGDPANPTLVDHHHFHLLLNGAYTDDELRFADQRHHLLNRLVQRIHPEERELATEVAAAFTERTILPPFLYEPNSSRAVNIDGNAYLWGRNLLANRLYLCPVLFLEPYVMNSTLDYPRIQAGDYEGFREVDGRMQPSIFREYADAVTEGVRRHFRNHRPVPISEAGTPAEDP